MIDIIRTHLGTKVTVNPSIRLSQQDREVIDLATRTLTYVLPRGHWNGADWIRYLRQVYGWPSECHEIEHVITLLEQCSAHCTCTEEAMPKAALPQPHMFPTGDDLPLFSGAPPKATVKPFQPQAVATQLTAFDLCPTFGAAEPTYTPEPEAK